MKTIIKKTFMLLLSISLIIGFIPISVMASPISQPTIIVQNWNAAEITMQSSQIYDNPFLDVEINATFIGPNGEVITRPGFWDGETTWKVRFAPTCVGTWNYYITSNHPEDTGLSDIKGIIDSEPYTGNLEIYQKGFLKSSEDNRYLIYADGSPFFWLGDTHWFFEGKERWDSSNVAGIDSQFKYMVDRRVQQEFTIYQSVIFGSHESYWKQDGYGTVIDADYFRENVDRKMEYISQAGLVNAFGIGFSSNVDNFVDGEKRLAKYIVARYGAYPMVYLTAGEGAGGTFGDIKTERISAWEEVAKEFHYWDSYNHPQTAHYTALSINEQTGLPIYYVGQGWMDFTMLQGGHKYVAPQQEYQFYYNNFNQPFLESESNYEMINDGWATEEIVRRSAYRSIQAGGFGYTYGANGIWNAIWDDNDTADESGYGHHNWNDAIEFAGADQMTLMKRFYQSIPWQTLIPVAASDAKWSNTVEEFDNPVIKADRGYNYITVFYPPRTACTGELANVPVGTYVVKWYNPRTGEYTIGTDIISNGNLNLPMMPDDNDWMLLLKRSDAVEPAVIPYNPITTLQSEKQTVDNSIIYDLGSVYELSCLSLAFGKNGLHRYTIETSIDGSSWDMAIDRSEAGVYALELPENLSGQARYIRIKDFSLEQTADINCRFGVKSGRFAMLQSNYFVVDQLNNIVDGVPEGCMVADFFSKTFTTPGASITVLNGTEALTSDQRIFDGMSVKILSQDTNTEREYLIKTIDNNGVNLAYHKPVTASSVENPYYSAAGVTDGNNDTINFHGWSADQLPAWIEIDLEGEVTVNKLKLYTKKDYEISDYTIQYMNAQGEWVNCFLPVEGNLQDIRSHLFSPVTTNRLRVLATKGSIIQPGIVRIQELELYNLPGILVEQITVTSENDMISTPEGTLQMSVQVMPENVDISSVSWSVVNQDGSPTKRATIDKSGLLKAISNGTVKVVAMSKDGTEITGEKIIIVTNQNPENELILISQGKSNSASTQLSNAPSNQAFDGDLTNNWIASDGSMPQWLMVDLEGNYKLNLIEQIFAVSDEYRYLVEGSLSGEEGSWYTLIDQSSYTGVSEKSFSKEVSNDARFVRFTILGARSQWASSKEFRVYGHLIENETTAREITNSN